MDQLINPLPQIYQRHLQFSDSQRREVLYFSNYLNKQELNENFTDEIDKFEIYDLIRNITDPEHPLSLEQLKIVCLEDIIVIDNKVFIEITPTIPHFLDCTLALTIGLSIRVMLERCLPLGFKINIKIKKGTHLKDDEINKQIKDKERVLAAMENAQLVLIVNNCLRESVIFEE